MFHPGACSPSMVTRSDLKADGVPDLSYRLLLYVSAQSSTHNWPKHIFAVRGV